MQSPLGTKHSQDEPRLRLALIGFGRAAERFHLPALMGSDRFDLAGVCDPLAQRRDLARKAIADVPIFGDPAELIADTDPDALLIATPPREHARLASWALMNGRHVLVEKPFAISLSDARSIASAASANSRCAAAGYNRRFKSSYGKLKRRLADSNHEILSVRFELGVAPGKWDPVSGYLNDSRAGGWVDLDVVSHQLDLLPWLYDSRIDKIRIVEDYSVSRHSQNIRFELSLSNGMLCECIARHGNDYTEHLGVRTATRHYLAHPTGLIAIRPRDGLNIYKLAAARNWMDRKFIRLGLREDEMGASYQRQLEEFAAYVTGAGAGDLATANDAIRVHAALEALAEARASPGVWTGLRDGS